MAGCVLQVHGPRENQRENALENELGYAAQGTRSAHRSGESRFAGPGIVLGTAAVLHV